MQSTLSTLSNVAEERPSGPGDHVQYEFADGIALITLNRPARRNALSIAAADRLHALWERVDNDGDVRVVVLAAAPCGTFCAGMDLKEAAMVRAETGRDVLDLMKDPFHERMRDVQKPIIAAMTGHFSGAGMVLSLNADLRVGLAGTYGGISEAKRGRGSPWAVPLAWMLPQPVLMELTLTAELMAVERFAELGFVNYVEASSGAVLERALQLARSIAANAPLSVLAGKGAIRDAIALGAEAGLAAAKERYRPVYASADAIEGPRAFAERRAPVWRGC
ncbi:enoyl-CoA hydratase/isomerase family protein [Paraburkholderia fungorum]|uniref:enoyl-CoA hydratase/isomerase family protein n=1 Tax=Paraburkholderia fungorum TaxID=134537 RepID=UPI002097B838|nr:enoyl-CoA hydratase-related protein [Paraburkholderia fungorum]USX06816.1 enoyl-CoA hydratase-related protein [Paraburkholderia fungorum]